MNLTYLSGFYYLLKESLASPRTKYFYLVNATVMERQLRTRGRPNH